MFSRCFKGEDGWLSRVVEVRVRLPEELAGLVAPRSLERETCLLVALELYREGRVSLGKAAEIAGLSVGEFMYELKARNVLVNYDVEELRRDLTAVEELLGKSG